MRQGIPIAILFMLTTFAGCLNDGAPNVQAPGDDPVNELVNSLEGFIDPFLMDHDHSDVGLHDLAFHMKQLDHHPLGGNVAKSSGAHVVDIRGDWLFVGAYGLEADVTGGVYIFNIEDPEHPQFTGHFPMVGAVGGDRSMEATADADWVVLGTEAINCANHVNPFLPGLYLIDASDKTRPIISDYIPTPNPDAPGATGIHSVGVHNVDGQDYAVVLGLSENILRINKEAGKFEAVGHVSISHDLAFANDPLLEKPILYVANVKDLQIYDFSDPANLEHLGAWTPPDNKNHYVHAVSMDLVEGRRILALESENWQDLPSPLWVLDATDFGAIQHVSTWTNPGQAPANAGRTDTGSLAFSTHNPRMEDGIIYLSHYHGGVWILDVRTMDKVHEPEIMGYYLPHEDNGGYKPGNKNSALPINPPPEGYPLCFGGFSINEAPNVMDLEVRDGIIYAADIHTGLYTLTYDVGVVPGPGHHN